METVDFLRLLWAAGPNYCVAFEAKRSDNGASYLRHEVFSTVVQAAARAVELGQKHQTYFAIHTLTHARLNGGMKGIRAAANMSAARCFYGDLDVGESTPTVRKFKSQREGVAALAKFCADTGLPMPMTVSSGRGVHVYWLLTEQVTSVEWLRIALKLKALAKAHDFPWDAAVVADPARVLRPIGTLNLKDRANPLRVELRGPVPERISAADFEALIDAALARVEPDALRVEFAEDRPAEKPGLKKVLAVCAASKVLIAKAPHASNPEWHFTNGLMAWVKDGDKFAHQLAATYIPPPNAQGYSEERTQQSLDQWHGLKAGPRCAKLEEVLGTAAPCKACQFRPLDSSPLRHALVIAPPLPEGVPQPGFPYARTKKGISYTLPPDPGAPPLSVRIYDYDLYPTLILDEHSTQTRAIDWTVVVPASSNVPEKSNTFRLKAGELGDERAVRAALANAGGFPDGGHMKKLMAYMSHYIRTLQRHQGEQALHETVGFTADGEAFVLPGGVITADGKTTPARLSSGLDNLAGAMVQKGTLAGHIEAMKFYDFPCYQPQQFVVLASLASILMHMTTYAGSLVNFGGDSGQSKSTALYGGASFWGHPEGMVLNGNPTGTSLKFRLERLLRLCTVPFHMDEVTLQTDEEIKQLAMGSTQGGASGRLEQTTKEKKQSTVRRSNIIITSANRSLHDHMARENQSGTATSMRTVDVKATGEVADAHAKVLRTGERVADQTKGEAFIRGLRQNHGHIGPTFARYVVMNRAKVEAMVEAAIVEVGKRADARVAERYWVVTVALVIVAARICNMLELLSYDAEALLEWAVTDLIKGMRGEVAETFQTPVELLKQYLASIASSTLITGESLHIGHRYSVAIVSEPKFGGVLARRETNNSDMWILTEGFKEFLRKKALSVGSIVAQLESSRVAVKDKVTLGKGTVYNVGQQVCLRVDLAHRDFGGMDALINVSDTPKVVPLRRA